MADKPSPPKRNHKKRADDARGTPKGAGTVATPNGGRIGNPPFVATEEQRQKVRALAKTMRAEMPIAKDWIASQIGVSVSTLDRHFKDDLVAGRSEIVASLGATMIGVATGTITNISRERLDAIKFALARIGGWSTKVEMTGEGGRPIEAVDLSGMTPAALREYGRQAAIQAGLDPDEAVGPPLDDDNA